MDDLVGLSVEDARWETIGIGALADAAARAALAEAGVAAGGAEIGLLAADDARIAELNARWRGRAGATNVLSWPAFALTPPAPGEKPPPPPRVPGRPCALGDIALAWETVLSEAGERGIPPAGHAAHLIVHGVLHLLGFDHETEEDAALMEAAEARALARIGLPDPYSERTPSGRRGSGRSHD
jgi:probable rRNA maturation factor